MSPEQREVEQEEGSEGREEGQDSPIACGDDIHLYDNQISPGPGQYTEREREVRDRERQIKSERAAGVRVCGGDKEGLEQLDKETGEEMVRDRRRWEEKQC